MDDRAAKGIDPASGTNDDAYAKFPDGTPKPHNAGKDATKFTSKEAFVNADEYIKGTSEYKNALAAVEKSGDKNFAVKGIGLEDIYGAKYKDQVFGKTRIGSKKNPVGTTETNFTDGTVTAVFKKDASGNWNLHIMYPEPKK